jgi:hypothetical protein
LASPTENKHDRLFEYVGLLVAGLIILIFGLTMTPPTGFVTAIVGAGVAAFGGLEVKFTYDQIRYDDRSLRAKQSGYNNIQTNQTNPTNSPVINRAETAHQYFNSNEPKGMEKAPKAKSIAEAEEKTEWICNGVFHMPDYQEFAAVVGKGDKIAGHVEADHPLSIQILNHRNYSLFVDIHEGDVDIDTQYKALYAVNSTTDCDLSLGHRQ